MTSQATITTIVQFINGLGIPCRENQLRKDTFLPGIDIQQGEILYDPELMKYPGDLLHEAGHVAMLLPEDRLQVQSPDKISGDLDPGAAEMCAIAWSWAALKHIGIKPEEVFHEHGYKGGGPNIVENFSEGRFFGIPLLSYFGMTHDPQQHNDDQTFPNMICWLRPEKKIAGSSD